MSFAGLGMMVKEGGFVDFNDLVPLPKRNIGLSEVLVPNAETLRSQSIAEGVGFSPRFSAFSATLRCKAQDDLFELALEG